MSVTGAINFIEEGHVREKTYQLKFQPPDNFPITNIASKEYAQKLEDVRGREDIVSVPTHGITVMNLDCCMAYEDYENHDLVHRVYCKQVADGVQRLLGASRIQIFEYVLRKRHAQFPLATGETYKYNQPTNTAHIDVTPAWAAGLARRMNEVTGMGLPSENFQFINAWKPLKGPIKDWPLAVCDASSVTPADLQEGDIVFEDRLIENYLVQFNPMQKWYYLSDQEPDEAWVFLQADSKPDGLCGAPHSSFQHPDHAQSQQPRESIEVRAIAFFENGRP